jgi:hypothetical protein
MQTGICLCVVAGCLTGVAIAQTSPLTGAVLALPAGATTLEGVPRIQVETTEQATTRRVLDAADASRQRLTIRLEGGKYFWGRDSRPLSVEQSGEYIYLSSAEPGKYLRLRRVNDHLAYVEQGREA